MRRILVVAMLAVALGAIAWFLLAREKEPVYEGKTLSVWLTNYLVPRSRGSEFNSKFETPDAWVYANIAVNAMGTNAFPILLRMLGAYDPPWKLKLISFTQKQHVIAIHHVPASQKSQMSSMAFASLAGDYDRDPLAEAMFGLEISTTPNINQAQADQLVPSLIEMLKNGPSLESRAAAARVLGEFGPLSKSAVPALVAEATNTSLSVMRFNCIDALGKIHSDPGLVVPVLASALSDTNLPVREAAVKGLAKVPPDLKYSSVVVPALAGLLSDNSIVWQNISYIPKALANYGAAAKSALPALHRFIEANPRIRLIIRDSATEAIEKIERAATAADGKFDGTNNAGQEK
jgi:hypothetical protein